MKTEQWVIAPTNDAAPDRHTIVHAQHGTHRATTYDPHAARIIAAAPELLSALNRLIDCPALNLDSLEHEDYEACDQVRAVLKKVGSL